MSVGKRLSTSDPLTEHDVAERLDKAVLRVLRIMADARQLGLTEAVYGSRYMTVNSLGALRAELDLWDVRPMPIRGLQDAPEERTDVENCTCVLSCADDPATACSLSGTFHVHPDSGLCPLHPDAPDAPGDYPATGGGGEIVTARR